MQPKLLSADLVNRILRYLSGRPFVEVAQLISDIQREANETMKAAMPPPPEAQ